MRPAKLNTCVAENEQCRRSSCTLTPPNLYDTINMLVDWGVDKGIEALSANVSGVLTIIKLAGWLLAGQDLGINRENLFTADIVLADEPTGSLDADNAAKVMAILSDLNAMGKTVVMVTHDTKYQKIGTRQIDLIKMK